MAPRSNFRLARYKLRTIKQEPSETVDSFLKKVRILVKECQYTNPDEHIIDAVIFGSGNPRVQSKRLEHDVSENDTQALLQLQVDSGHVTAPLLCKIDTGTEGNVIPVDIYKRLCPKSSYSPEGTPLGLTPSSTTITAFGGHTIPHYGICELTLSHHGHSKPCAFHVVNTVGPTILSFPTCRDMKLVSLNYGITTTQTEKAPTPNPQGSPDAKSKLLCQYQDCFQGIGCFQGEFHITLDPTVPPVIHPRRRVPESLREPLKREHDALVEQGIIAKVDEPTDWVNSLVCVTKANGTLRLCFDPKDLIHAIKRPHHCTPTLADVLPKLNGAKYFSIVDARSGYRTLDLIMPAPCTQPSTHLMVDIDSCGFPSV